MEAVDCEILYNEEVAPGYFRIGLRWKTPEIRPGHFAMVRVSDGLDPLLRRPFGVYKVIGQRGSAVKGTGIELLYAVVGKGTEILSRKRPGEFVGLLAPLGNGFPMPDKGQKAVMVSGGMGIVPLYLLARSIGSGVMLFGARSKKDARIAGDFKGLGLKLRYATEDGSLGKKGYVTELLKSELKGDPVVYACGPVGMLKAVSKIAVESNVKCYVSLERSMACGIGVCLGCAVKTRNHDGAENRNYRMVCSDGPVFDSGDIDWSML